MKSIFTVYFKVQIIHYFSLIVSALRWGQPSTYVRMRQKMINYIEKQRQLWCFLAAILKSKDIACSQGNAEEDSLGRGMGWLSV